MATKKAANNNESENTEDTMNDETTPEVTYPERSEAITVAPHEGGNALLSKWRGIYHVFDGRVEKWDVTPDGVAAINFSTNGRYDPNQVLTDLNISDRQRLGLLPALFYLQGQEPEPFTNSLDMTKWMATAFTKVKTEDGERSPAYVKDAIAAYKKAHEFPRKKGRPRKIIRVENLGSIDESVLAGVDPVELAKLAEKIREVQEATAK